MSERSQTYIAIETEGDKTMSERTVFYENIHGRIYPRAILEDVQQGEYPSIVVLDKAGYRCGYVGVDSNSKEFESVKERLNDIESHGNAFCYFNENFDKVVSDPCEKSTIGSGMTVIIFTMAKISILLKNTLARKCVTFRKVLNTIIILMKQVRLCHLTIVVK